MNHRENMLRAIRFDQPDFIPMRFHINPACWKYYDPSLLRELIAEHTFLFGSDGRTAAGPVFLPNQLKDHPWRDPWGCEWQTAQDGITGCVHHHPLSDWSRFDRYDWPDPEMTDGLYEMDWLNVHAELTGNKVKGIPANGSLPHGHTFLRLCDLRGYENLLFDMHDRQPKLIDLIEGISEFNIKCVMKWLEGEPDMMGYPEDLGMQNGPMLSPEHFIEYILPVYRRIIEPARKKGCLIHFHSDGDLHSLMNSLLDIGVNVFNLQDRVNGIDWIADRLKGRVCIDLDIDRQQVTPNGTPDQIDRWIRYEVETLGSKAGGLMMVYGLYPGVPIENVKATMCAMEKYADYYS